MKKLIVKTIVAALLTILSLFIIVLGTLSLTLPRFMEKLAGNLGLVQTEATYSILAYKKDKKIENLSIAVQKNYYAKIYNNAASYGLILIQDKNFDAYCQTQPNIPNSPYTTKVFLQAITAESFFYIGNTEQTLSIAQNDSLVVDWLLQLPKIQADKDFSLQLENIKKPINTKMQGKKGGIICLK